MLENNKFTPCLANQFQPLILNFSNNNVSLTPVHSNLGEARSLLCSSLVMALTNSKENQYDMLFLTV